jgi:hypothetical protein
MVVSESCLDRPGAKVCPGPVAGAPSRCGSGSIMMPGKSRTLAGRSGQVRSLAGQVKSRGRLNTRKP